MSLAQSSRWRSSRARLCRGLAGAMIAAIASSASAQGEVSRASAADLRPRLERAQAEPKLREAALKRGRRVAAVCAHCHGEGGVSTKPEVPNLAGQNALYLVEQFRQFSDGRRRNEFMEDMIKAMSADEKVSAILFYASQTVPPQPVRDAALVARGRDQYSRNCFRCHGHDGRGTAHVARLAGQQGSYLMATLVRYRAGAGPRVNPLMADATRTLRDADIEALAAFISSMP